MDRRSWPWRRRTSEKASNVADSNLQSSNSGSDKVDQDDSKNIQYVQVPAESYARLTELEDDVNVLNEKFSSAQAEITTKDNLVKQHAKVAEDAVSGWEKAEAEATTLKNQLESVMLMKLTAEEKVSQLDGALKECMKQIHNVKEESEQKLHDVVFGKTKQWEKVKLDLEAKVKEFEQELLRASAENNAISRSLQERNNILMRISEEKSQAEADIEVLKANMQAYENEISSLKYELHIISKELEIRNEEKNMSVRSAEVANKQHMEDVKKITKLEAECQRLRGLVRKKLPGPAALAQMKLEVESLGHEYGENKLRRSPAKNASPHFFQTPDYAFEQMQQFQKENELLTAKLLAMEKETMMLKEALSKRNGELQALRSMCAKTANKLHSIEGRMYIANQRKSPSSANFDINFESSVCHNESNQSVTSMSEDGIDDEASCAESWATALISELSHFKKDKDVNKGNRVGNPNQLELMDDFLEMERLACQSSETNMTSITATNGVTDKMRDENDDTASVLGIRKNGSKELDLEVSNNHDDKSSSNRNDRLSELQSRISSLFASQAHNADMGKILEDIRHILDDTHGEIRDQSEVTVKSETQPMDAFCEEKQSSEEIGVSTDSISLKEVYPDTNLAIERDLKIAISQIHDLVILFNKKAMEVQSKSFEDHEFNKKLANFSATAYKVLLGEISLVHFVSALSHILSVVSYKLINSTVNEREGNLSDCVDKGTLSLENRMLECEQLQEKSSALPALASPSGSDNEIEGHIVPSYELVEMKATCSFEEYEKLKLEKESIEMDLAKCTETLESIKLKLAETKKQVEELETELATCQKSNDLAGTQLKCMAESYKLLESRSHDWESKINLLCAKTETLENELQEEKRSHLEDLDKLSDIQSQLESAKKCLKCSASDEDADIKMKHETEIAAAAEKLAQCQETILLLGRQLRVLCPPAELVDTSPTEMRQSGDNILERTRTSGFSHQEMLTMQQVDGMDMKNVLSSGQKSGCESPFDGHNSYMSPSYTEPSLFQGSPISSKRQRQRSIKSSSSPFSTNTSSEKHRRGFSRFFSKGKSDH